MVQFILFKPPQTSLRTHDRNVEAVNREGNEAFSDTLEKVENSLIKMQQIVYGLTDIPPGGKSL